MGKTTMGIKLDQETRDRLKALGKVKERTPHWLMVHAIREYLDREETVEREKAEDLQRLQRYKETGEYLDHRQVESRLAELEARVLGEKKKSG